MDKMTPMDPEYQETPPEWQPGTPGYYGTGRLPKPPRSHTGLIVVLLCVMIVANVITVLMLLTLRMRAVQKNTTVGAETETGVTPTLTAPSGHSVEPTEPRTNGTGTLQISAEDTQTRSAGEIYTALRPSLALVYADGNGGTAIVMTADGYLITNAHTVSGAESITVQLSDGMEYAAALSGMDESSDLAVLKIEPETALQPAEFGDSAGAAAGDTVYMFSHPFGAAFDNATMTDGSIAAVQSGVRIGAETLNVFQTDAAPDSGSAGGPLVNEAGQVIGICIDHVGSYVSYQTVPELGFAIPISEAKTILDDLIVNGYVSGRVSLGLTVSEIPETYRRFWGLPSGVVIESVTAGSNAYYAGLHAGDVICQLGDSAVTNLNDYRSILSACHVGEELRVYIYRDGRQYYTDVTLTRVPRRSAWRALPAIGRALPAASPEPFRQGTASRSKPARRTGPWRPWRKRRCPWRRPWPESGCTRFSRRARRTTWCRLWRRSRCCPFRRACGRAPPPAGCCGRPQGRPVPARRGLWRRWRRSEAAARRP